MSWHEKAEEDRSDRGLCNARGGGAHRDSSNAAGTELPGKKAQRVGGGHQPGSAGRQREDGPGDIHAGGASSEYWWGDVYSATDKRSHSFRLDAQYPHATESTTHRGGAGDSGNWDERDPVSAAHDLFARPFMEN